MAFVDPYFDGRSGELRNLLNVKSAEEFQELESQIVFANELELEAIGIPRTNDFTEVLLIHKQLFKVSMTGQAKYAPWILRKMPMTQNSFWS